MSAELAYIVSRDLLDTHGKGEADEGRDQAEKHQKRHCPIVDRHKLPDEDRQKMCEGKIPEFYILALSKKISEKFRHIFTFYVDL